MGKKDKKKKKKEKKRRRKDKANKQVHHGFITPNDLINKMPEFTSWLIECHGVGIDTLVKREEKKWFNKFCDDWNTSTLADEKYYDLDAWNKQNGGGNVESVHANNNQYMFGSMTDEQQLKAQQRAQRQMVSD